MTNGLDDQLQKIMSLSNQHRDKEVALRRKKEEEEEEEGGRGGGGGGGGRRRRRRGKRKWWVTSLVPRPPCFCLPFAFTIIHGNERPTINGEVLGAFTT